MRDEGNNSDLLARDLLHGAAEIAEFLGLTERQARHQIDRGTIPVIRMGRLIIGSKTALRKRFTPRDVEAA